MSLTCECCAGFSYSCWSTEYINTQAHGLVEQQNPPMGCRHIPRVDIPASVIQIQCFIPISPAQIHPGPESRVQSPPESGSRSPESSILVQRSIMKKKCAQTK